MSAEKAIAMQALARAVYPERQVATVVPHIVLMWPASTVPKGRIDYTPAECFDPANNSEQFVEVLAWLIGREIYDAWNVCLDGSMGYVCWNQIRHDGTAADIRRAVVEAAIMVAGEKK